MDSWHLVINTAGRWNYFLLGLHCSEDFKFFFVVFLYKNRLSHGFLETQVLGKYFHKEQKTSLSTMSKQIKHSWFKGMSYLFITVKNLLSKLRHGYFISNLSFPYTVPLCLAWYQTSETHY